MTMPATMNKEQRRPGKRGKEAFSALGPVGYLFGSASTAHVLDIFAAEPETPLTLGDILKRYRAAKGTVQGDLRTLMRAHLIRREGSGTKTRYRYALDNELGREMLVLVRLSRRQARAEAAPDVDIPWLASFAQDRPAAGLWIPFGEREEDHPSDEAVQRVLETSIPTAEARESRTLPGLRTRR